MECAFVRQMKGPRGLKRLPTLEVYRASDLQVVRQMKGTKRAEKVTCLGGLLSK